MKCILRNYGIGMNTVKRQAERARAADFTRTRGTARVPLPPRDIIAQAGPRGILLTWNLPERNYLDIQRWRVYKDDENTLYAEVTDRGTRSHFIEATAGSSPPVTNFFVSSINSLGVESPKVQVQGSAAVEASAPSMPSTPPGYTQTGSGGGNRTTDYSGSGGAGRGVNR